MIPMRSFLPAALLCLLFSATARSATIFTDSGSFNAAVAPGAYVENFNQTDPPVYSSNGFSYAITTSLGPIDDAGTFITTAVEQQTLTLNFTSGNVTAVGGNFFVVDVNNTFQASVVTINLSDGTTDSFTTTSAADFRGYSTGPSGPVITTLTLAAPASLRFNAIDNIVVGAAVPEPSVTLLLGALPAAVFLRRRRNA